MLELSNVSSGYAINGTYKKILNEINIKTETGKITGILGSSGSGKTTLLKTLLNKAYIESGIIKYNGNNIFLSLKSFQDFRNKIAYIPQNSLNSLNIFENIGLQLNKLMKSLKITPDMDYVNSMINKFMLPENIMKLKPGQISDGMKHRVIILMALATGKEIFLFDEPTTGLDPVSAHDVLLSIVKLKDKHNIIITGNDVESIFSICDYIHIMYNGTFVEDASYSDILKSQLHPYTYMLLKYIPSYEKRNEDIKYFFNDVKNGNAQCVFINMCPHAEPLCENRIEYNYINGHGYRCIRYPEWKHDKA